MITKVRLDRLFAELDGSQTLTGAITVRRALALIETVRRGGGLSYRVDVGALSVHSNHHSSWTAILIDVTAAGIQLMRQRWTSCPGCGSASCAEIDARPVVLDGDDEWELFIKWGHIVVVSQDVLKLLKAHNPYPFKQYPLAASEAQALISLPSDLRELFDTIRKVIGILVETKGSFKSERVAYARRALNWALERQSLSINE